MVVSLAFAVGATGMAQQDDLSIARAAVQAGKTGVAVDAFGRWLTMHPTDVDVLREASRFAKQERRLYEAAAWLQRLVEQDPGSPANLYDLAATRFTQGRFELAIPLLRQMEALESTTPSLATRSEHYFLHGDAARRIEQWGEALAALEIAVARAPDRREYRRIYAESLHSSGRFEEAAAQFQNLVREEPRADNYYGLAVALGEQNKLADAVTNLREARRLKPKEPRTLAKLGTYCMRRNELRFAESFLLEAQEVAPKNVETLFALAQVYRLQGRAAEAAEVRALGEKSQAELDAARERDRVFRRARVNDPENLAAHVTFGLDLLQQGRFDDAQLIFQQILSFAPTHELSILNLSSLLAQGGDMKGAIQEVTKLFDVDPKHPIASLQMGRLLMRMRDPGAAITHLKVALERNEKNREVHEALAVCFKALGNVEEAERHAARARSLVAVESQPAAESAPTSRR